MGKTLYQKVYDAHVVMQKPGELPLLYIDRHIIHEVTSPQAFAGLRAAGRKLRRPDLMLATMDHDISTRKPTLDACMPLAKKQVTTLMANCQDFGVTLYGLGNPGQGIVHIVGPQSGFTLPGTTLVCGDSHTATHGAFGALAFGIGTSEVEHVMATQTLKQQRLKTMRIRCDGRLRSGVYAKDLILAIAGKLTTAGGTGYAVEFAGEAVKALTMEGRMTLCNMAIEMGAKVGMVAPDEVTFEYVKGRLFAPKGAEWDEAVAYRKTLATDEDAQFDKEVVLDAAALEPQVTWGTNPGQEGALTGCVPTLESFDNPVARQSAEAALAYIDLKPGQKLIGTPIDIVFIGSCTNGRIEDFREAARVAKGRKVAPGVQALAVPGSMAVREMAEAEGIAKILSDAGFEWRLPGCSMCLAMNDDRAEEGSRVASTSNRNFVGRQGKGSRTHLMSPASAAAAAISLREQPCRNSLVSLRRPFRSTARTSTRTKSSPSSSCLQWIARVLAITSFTITAGWMPKKQSPIPTLYLTSPCTRVQASSSLRPILAMVRRANTPPGHFLNTASAALLRRPLRIFSRTMRSATDCCRLNLNKAKSTNFSRCWKPIPAWRSQSTSKSRRSMRAVFTLPLPLTPSAAG